MGGSLVMALKINHFAKYPVWLRAVLIVGLSATLWTGIILTVEAL